VAQRIDSPPDQARLLHLNRLYAMAAAIGTTLLRSHDQATLLDKICRIAVERGHLQGAWIVLRNADQTRMGAAAQGTADSAGPLSPETFAELIACSECVRGGKPLFLDAGGDGPAPASWRAAADRHGWRAAACLPLLADGATRGWLGLGAAEAGCFDPEARHLLLELAADLGYALDHLEKARQQSYLVLYDALTGLANRTLFLDRLSQLMHRKDNAPFAVVVFDVDRFKHINETLTYQAGDYLLKTFARRLSALAPETHLARPSGDDFALVLPDAHDEHAIACFIHDTLIPAITRPVDYDGQELRLALKVGIACFPDDGTDPATLLGNAELAHRNAQNSSVPFLFFAENMNQGAGEFLRVESRLRRALEHREFLVFYQPKIDLREGRINGVEALLRWRDPERGLVAPDRFIGILEETGLILEIGRWMIEEAGDQYLRWASIDPAPPRIAVNVSPLQLCQPGFVADVEAALAACRDHRGYLELEITESAIMHDVEENTQKLRAVRDMGVEISIDDFGTGYSSLSYLTRLPLTRLKIDRSFIVNMTESADSLAVVNSIISLAHTLNLKVAAEGVETPEQLKFLRLLRCDEIQGYLFSPPVAPDEALALKARHW
jgi:diguanylate cyclase (GGDEF)-like protein